MEWGPEGGDAPTGWSKAEGECKDGLCRREKRKRKAEKKRKEIKVRKKIDVHWL